MDKMPRAKYTVFHCDQDKAVNIESHSEKFVKKMQESGFDVSYTIVPGRGHCDLPQEMWERFWTYTLDAINS